MNFYLTFQTNQKTAFIIKMTRAIENILSIKAEISILKIAANK